MEFKPLVGTDNPLISSRSKRQVTFPAVAFSRTPTRQRHVVLQAAARTHTPVASAKKLQEADPYLRLMSPPAYGSFTPTHNDAASMRSSRAGKENTLNTLNTLNSPSRPTSCLNHPNKQGTYEAKDQGNTERFLYCQKCAILLASQGFKVSKLSKPQPLQDRNERTAIRRVQLSTLHELTQQSQRLLEAKQEELEQLENGLDSLVEDQEAIIDEHFGKVHQLVEKFHHLHRAHLAEQRCQAHSILQQLQQIVEEEKQQISQIEEDIMSHDQTALKVAEQRYTPVVEFYKLKLNSFRNGWKGLPTEDLLPKRPEFRQDGELIAAMEGLFALQVRTRQASPFMSRSKRIKGKPSSVHFSFETDNHDLKLSQSVIPELEEGLDMTAEQNLLEEFPSGNN